MLALLIASLTGCAPQDAIVKGDWFVWLAANSAATVDEGELNLDNATRFDCYVREDGSLGWDVETCSFDDRYIGSRKGYSSKDNHIGGDCAREEGSTAGVCDGDFVKENKETGVLPHCGAEEDTNKDGVIDGHDAIAAFAEECADIRDAEYQTWLKDDGYYAMTGKIGEYKNAKGELVNDTWRSEAIINSEGDLQLTVHVDIGNGQDFRYHFTIDPDFNPKKCVTNDEGKPEIQDDDQSSWVDEWSEDEDGYRIFYLNAGSYQVNPNDSETWWYLNSELLSGWGFSKFAAEEFYSQAGRYGNYDEEGNGPGFIGIEDHENPDLAAYTEAIEDLCAQVYGWDCIYLQTDDDGDGESEADGDCDDKTEDITSDDCPEIDPDEEPLSWQDEMIVMAGAAKGGEPQFGYKIENNTWRPIDQTITGLDGWMEVHSSWVRLKNGSKIEEGGKVTGDYQLMYDGAESGSRLLVRGEFTVDDLREDQWGYEILEDVKRDENKTDYCVDPDEK